MAKPPASSTIIRFFSKLAPENLGSPGRRIGIAGIIFMCAAGLPVAGRNPTELLKTKEICCELFWAKIAQGAFTQSGASVMAKTGISASVFFKQARGREKLR